ncbi:MAG: rRNA maturation RNase YbeY [Candidatus Izimaplasma sp.]|nr:rRNA maturation RNase YbeY [Candidatus Izimaplasma bacterium]
MKANIVNNYNQEDYTNLINKVLTTAENKLQIRNKSINIILIDNAEILKLNQTYRKIDKVTDVLTFPDGYLNNLGDIFISIPKCEEQANSLEHSFNRELGFLVVHGFLHSLGYDHQNEDEEKEMINLQNQILYKAKLNR